MTFDEIQSTVHVTFHDTKLLQHAFYHRSYLNEAKQIKESNERLEFLGDAILSFLTSQFLYLNYPNYPEGVLTNIRSSLVKTKSLGESAKALGFGDLLFLSHGEEESGGRNNMSLLADSFEAFLGALFLDQGIETTKQFLTTYLFSKTAEIVETKSYLDFKSLLQEIVQEDTKVSPIYQVAKSEGPDHNRLFYIEAYIGTKKLGVGKGKSKQEGEQAAAANALEKMGKI